MSRVLRHVGVWYLLCADPSGGSSALAVEQAGTMCGPVIFRHPADFAEQGPFLQSVVYLGLRGVPIDDGQASKEFWDLTGWCSYRDLGLGIPWSRDHQPTADPSGVRAVHGAMCSVGRVGAGWNRYDDV
ncbi:hypothetical protein IscW_ISCW012329 [Ixodes scapularis]|uniref:Uncharacterized protein n=1 Tax=Ixodes scapularis TaxID=6945 RepID=B7QC30_IXOSC|nr:hypothetical protein IscW_ISCW012329 [Ixodes scapularis]|eukprot:XP_002413094.1 hypothetical protein IscW_ISCW012329 [Ixodes scapularis]